MRAFVLTLAIWTAPGHAVETVLATLASDLVPGPVAYAVLAPDGYGAMKELPLILNLHGGGGSRQTLLNAEAIWHEWWATGVIPPAIVVTPSVTARCFYMNFHDGSERWEDFILGPFLEHLRQTYPVSAQREKTLIMGTSMGGMGSLRMAFRQPQTFAAVAALEPGIEPVLTWAEIRPKHRFFRKDALFEAAFGKPVDAAYWAANNPASMAVADPERLRASGLQIYVEAGDEDQFWLYEGAEFLHQMLWNARIKHEYHLVRGADHVGESLVPRTQEAVRFLFRTLEPWGEPPLRVRAAMRLIERQKRGLEERDHYSESPQHE